VFVNHQIIIKVIGAIVLILGVAMIPPAIAAHVYDEQSSLHAFMATSLLLMLAGGFVSIKMRPHSIYLGYREGYIIVTLCWLCASLVGAVPYLASGFTDSFPDAFFESVSGFTTTGASTFDVEAMPNSITLWKVISHFLGGMGILVFAISILPAIGAGGQKIFKAEAPGPTVVKVATRISDSAKILYLTYIIFAVAEFILLNFSSMGVFDALINTLSSISASGHINHYAGIEYYDSAYVEFVIGVFLILTTINFVLYSSLIQGHWREFIASAELRAYLAIIAGASILVSWSLYANGSFTSVFSAARRGVFQVVAMATTTGYPTNGFTEWPTLCKMVLFILMFIGGCASSTGGAMKVVRILVMLKLISRGISKRLHPRSVVAVKLEGKAISSDTVSSITSFIMTYIVIFFISSIILSFQNLDFVTTITTSATFLADIGCNISDSGDIANNYALFSAPLKLYLSLLMIVGRLELFTIIILLSPKFWNPDR